jgi:SAM-dependent methyltransferase
MPAIARLDPYTALADVYQAAGLAAYSENLVPRLIDIAYQLEWSGRTALDLACGTGDAAMWLAMHNFRVWGVDLSPAMIRHASERAEKLGIDATFIQADMRAFHPERQYDLVTCLGGSLNYISTLRDIEAIFQTVRNTLLPGKLFIFDLHTIRGMAEDAQHYPERITFDNGENIFIATRNTFSYESLLLTTQYTIMAYDGKAGWQRAEEIHSLRGYPIQAVTRLLGQMGLKVRRILSPSLEATDDSSTADMLIFVAMREG